MEWSELIDFIRDGESMTTQFIRKAESIDDLAPTIIAMANSMGGKLFVGFDHNNYHLTGCELAPHDIQTFLREKVTPSIHIHTDTIQKSDKTILCISTQSGMNKPYLIDGKSYVLDGINVREASQDDINDMQRNNPNRPTTHTVDSSDFREEFSSQLNADSPSQLDLNSLRSPNNLEINDTFEEDLDRITEELISINNDSETPHKDQRAELRKSDYFIPHEHPPEINNRQEQALFLLKSGQSGFIKNKRYRELYNVSHKTAHLELVDLVDRGYFKQEGSGRSTCYKITEKGLNRTSSLTFSNL